MKSVARHDHYPGRLSLTHRRVRIDFGIAVGSHSHGFSVTLDFDLNSHLPENMVLVRMEWKTGEL